MSATSEAEEVTRVERVEMTPATPTLEPLEIEEPNTSDAAEDETQYPSGRPVFLVFVASGLALMLMGLDGQILATAVPAITTEFHTLLDIGWYNAGLRLTLCSFLFLFGKLYTIVNSKVLLLASMAWFEVGSLVCGLSPTSFALIVGRAVQGVGCSGIVMGTYTMVNSTVAKRKRPFVLGCLGAVEMGSQAMAPVIGGVLASRLNWRWCFYINLPLGLMGMAIIAKYYRTHKAPSHQGLSLVEKLKLVDPVGTLLLLPSLLSLLIALQLGGSVYAWSNPRVIACFAVGGVLAGAFAWWQVRCQEKAILPPRILRRKVVLGGMLFLACNNGCISIIQYYLPTYFQTIKQLSPQASGYLVLPFLIPFVICLALNGSLVSVIGYYYPFMLISAILTPIGAGLMTTLTVQSSLVRVSAYQALLGFGSGIGFQGPQFAVQALLSPADLQLGIACLQFGQKFGPAIVIPAAQALFVNTLSVALQQDGLGASANVTQGISLLDLKSKIQASQFQKALAGFDEALMHTFYLPVALASLVVVGVLATESKSLKRSQ